MIRMARTCVQVCAGDSVAVGSLWLRYDGLGFLEQVAVAMEVAVVRARSPRRARPETLTGSPTAGAARMARACSRRRNVAAWRLSYGRAS